jgi:WD40 repeat protein
MSMGQDGAVRRWELPVVLCFGHPGSWVVGMDLSRQGSWLATASQDGHAFIIDRRDLSRPPVATISATTPLQAVLFDPTDPQRILTLGRSEPKPQLWSWSDDGKVEPLPANYKMPPLPTYGFLVSRAVSPDGTTIAGGDTGGSVHLWDARTGALRSDRALPGSGQPADSVTFDSTGQLLAATGAFRAVRTSPWTAANMPAVSSVTTQRPSLLAVRVSRPSSSRE